MAYISLLLLLSLLLLYVQVENFLNVQITHVRQTADFFYVQTSSRSSLRIQTEENKRKTKYMHSTDIIQEENEHASAHARHQQLSLKLHN